MSVITTTIKSISSRQWCIYEKHPIALEWKLISKCNWTKITHRKNLAPSWYSKCKHLVTWQIVRAKKGSSHVTGVCTLTQSFWVPPGAAYKKIVLKTGLTDDRLLSSFMYSLIGWMTHWSALGKNSQTGTRRKKTFFSCLCISYALTVHYILLSLLLYSGS